jgi:PAS domain S-box-containing protein
VERQRSALSGKARFAAGAILLALLVTVAGLAWQLIESSNSRRQIVLGGNRASARIASGLVAAELGGHIRAIEGLSRRPALVSLMAQEDWKGINTHLRDLKSLDSALTTAGVVDAEGRLRALEPDDPSLIGQDFSARDYFRGATSSTGGYVSEVFRQKAAPYKMVIAFASAVRDESDRVLGVVVGGYPTDAFGTIARTAIPNAGSIRIFDHNGHDVSKADADPPPSHASHPLVKRALSGRSGTGESELPALSGVRLVAYEPVPAFGWSVFVEQAKADAFAPVGALAGRLAGVGGVLTLMALVSALMLLRLIRQLDRERGRTSALLGSTMDAVVSMDADGNITEFNIAAERMFRYRRREVLGKAMADTIVPPELAESHRRGLTRYLDTGEAKVIGKLTEISAMRSDGTIFPVELSIGVVDNPGLPTFIGVIRDITGRKKAEESLRASESYKSALLESVAEAVVTTDSKGRVTTINPAMESLAGWNQDEVAGKLYSEAYPFFDSKGEELPRERRLLEEAIADRRSVASHGFDLMLQTRHGRRIPIAVTASPILDRNGTFHGGVDVIRDVTHEKEVDQMKSALISTVSHELRTPLTMIQGFSELLLTPKFDRRNSREALEQIKSASERLGRLIEDLLSVSRIESGRLVVRSEPMRLAPVLKEVLAEFPYGREIKSKVESHLPKVMADRDMVVQILTNLVSNAAKYSPDETPIAVAAKGNGRSVEISVTDRGIGLTEDEQGRLFERFYRADRPEFHGIGGTGLGLYITKSLVEMQGGQIWVDSAPGRGSTFSFSLPTADANVNGAAAKGTVG